MRNLLHATDRDRLIAHLRSALLREVSVGGHRLMALAESDGSTGGSFCVVSSNASAAELLIQPGIRDADPAFADGLLDFAMAMADAPLPCRRVALGGLEVLRDDPCDFEILTPFHRFTGNLSLGLVQQHWRGAGAALPPLVHSGNLVEFRIGRRKASVDAEDSIANTALRRVGQTVVLEHESRIMGKAGLLRARPVQAGTLRYRYEIQAGSPLLRLTVSFTATSPKLGRLRLTTAVDQLGAEGLDLAEARVQTGPDGSRAWRAVAVPQQPDMAVWADAVAVSHLAVGQAGWPEGGPVLHLRPGDPAGVLGAKAQAMRAGAVHWLILRHGPVDLKPGESFEVTEQRLLAPGTSAEAASAMMAAAAHDGAALAGLDLDPLPPNGATLNAVATTLFLAAQGAYAVPLSAARVATLSSWLDRGMAAFQPAQASVLDLAHAVLAAELRLRAGSDPAPFQSLLQALLARQGADGSFPGQATLVAHATALLALARAVPHGDAERLADPIARALDLVRPGLAPMLDQGQPTRIEGLILQDAPPPPIARHAEGIGLMARAAGAVLLAAEAQPEAIGAATVASARSLLDQAVALLRPLVRPRAGALEVVPSPLGGPATPASQAAASLALLAPDVAIMRKTSVSA